MTTESVFAALGSQVKGRMVLAGDAGYDEARRVFNAMIDRHPGAILFCLDTADVIAGVRFAVEHELLLAVRGGGHNGGGLGVCDGGLVLDLSGLDEIEVDAAARSVRVGGGCL